MEPAPAVMKFMILGHSGSQTGRRSTYNCFTLSQPLTLNASHEYPYVIRRSRPRRSAAPDSALAVMSQPLLRDRDVSRFGGSIEVLRCVTLLTTC